MPLTDTAIRAAKLPKGRKRLRLYDAKGLYLEIGETQGEAPGKRWRFKYRHQGKEKRLSLGVYPDVSLAQARERRDAARSQVAGGVDPSAHRKAVKASRIEREANSLEVVAREWFSARESNWSNGHGDRIIRRLERDIFPTLGGRPIAEISAPELLAVIRKIEERGALETAHRALADCGQVFRYAVATGRAERDPSGDLRGALPPVKAKHFAAITEPLAAGELLRKIHGYQGTRTVQCALRLAPLVFVRPSELRMAEWAHINFDTAEWRYTVSKTQTEHVVPLAAQAVSILKELHAATGGGKYLFPSLRSVKRPMSDNAILVALRSMGVGKEEMTGHGFRAMARTILDEVLGVRPDFIEHQLAHAVLDPNGRAYNRTAHLAERHRMMQQWADYLDKLRNGADVIPLRGNAA